MSTPQHVPTPPRGPRKQATDKNSDFDLREQMKLLLELQYEQQQHVQQEQQQRTSSATTALSSFATASENQIEPPARKNNITSYMDLYHESNVSNDDEEVGHGTLYFEPEALAQMTSSIRSTTSSNAAQESPKWTSFREQEQSSLLKRSSASITQEQIYQYGSTDDSNPNDDDPRESSMPPEKNNKNHPHHLTAQKEELPQQDSTVLIQNLEGLRYAPGLYPGDVDDDFDKRGDAYSLLQRMESIFCHDHLARSFCFGAIDGLLTGTGILFAFMGMDILSSSSNDASKRFCLIFTTAACCADALCMALGHVWTTFIVLQAQAKEKRQAREHLINSKAHAKGQMVDLLLSKGMLKIDAMSLADTLEGYPDLFVNVLTSESLQTDNLSSACTNPLQTPVYESYGQLSSYDMDPVGYAVMEATHESRVESLAMLLGFATFAVVPSFMFCWMKTEDIDSSSPSTVHAITILTLIVCAVMWLLGVWKSRFLDQHTWVLFGFETVLVLLLCMACSYGSGRLLTIWFLPDFQLNTD